MKKTIFNHVRDLCIIIFSTFIFSIGINSFAIPNHLAEGGFYGITLLLYYFWGWSPSIMILVLNIPLLIIGYRVFGKRTFFYTIIALSSLSYFFDLTKNLNPEVNDPLLAALYTGILVGAGMGFIIRVGGTSGGVAILARLANKYLGASIGQVVFVFDFTVILVSILVIGLKMAMYTLVTVFVSARIVEFVVEGLDAAKGITIISTSPRELAFAITERLNRGVTILDGRGGFTGKKKEVLYVVVAPSEFVKLKKIVNEKSPDAFLVVHNVRDVLGKGFSSED